MPNAPAMFAAATRASGLPTELSLLELQTVSGQTYFLSDGAASTPALMNAYLTTRIRGLLAAPFNVTFVPWLLKPPVFEFTGTLLTVTSGCTIQNLSGNTVSRDMTSAFTAQQLWGSSFAYRLWNPAAQVALLTVFGNVSDVDVSDDAVDLTLRGWMNWAEVKAPDCRIDNTNCQNVFGSLQCGSTSSTRCENTYGTCSQLNRFKSIVTQWSNADTVIPTSSVGQPVPISAINLRRPA